MTLPLSKAVPAESATAVSAVAEVAEGAKHAPQEFEWPIQEQPRRRSGAFPDARSASVQDSMRSKVPSPVESRRNCIFCYFNNAV